MDAVRHRFLRLAWWLLGSVLAAVAVIAIVVWLPHALVNADLTGHGTKALSERGLASSINDARATLVQALAGTLVVVSAFTAWRQYALARQAHLTERYVTAVGLIASETIEGRTGGVYALERLARDSRLQLEIVVDVLAAFIRSRAPVPSELPEWQRGDDTYYDAVGFLLVRKPDVQAAVGALARFDVPWNRERRGRSRILYTLQLPQVDLRRAYLYGARLSGVALTESRLELAQLSDADLTYAQLDRTHMDGALLCGTDLRGADLSYAVLRGAELDGRTRLSSALLQGADLSDTHLEEVALDDAQADVQTLWPEGFSPRDAGVRFVDDEDQASNDHPSRVS